MIGHTDGAGRICEVDQGGTQSIHLSGIGKEFLAQAQVECQSGSDAPIVANEPGGTPLPPSKFPYTVAATRDRPEQPCPIRADGRRTSVALRSTKEPARPGGAVA